MSAAQPEEANHTLSSSSISLADRCAQVHARVRALLARNYETGGDADTGDARKNERLRRVQRQTTASLRILAEALERYGLDKLSLSYNGGKDCLVLLLLYLAALHTYSTTHNISLPPTLPTVYIITPNPFPAVTHFVQASALDYRLDLASYSSPMRDAFAAHLASHPNIEAIFVGTRRTDPHGATLGHFDPTDRGWPAFMRIHPVIDWHYADIWGFIKELGVDYCELYDEGYTSLGGITDTKRNPALQIDGGETGGKSEGIAIKFRPAYELMEDDEERLGRD